MSQFLLTQAQHEAMNKLCVNLYDSDQPEFGDVLHEVLTKVELHIPLTDPPELTDAQLMTIWRKWRIAKQDKTFIEFLAGVGLAGFGCGKAVAVEWCGMILCIETDGVSIS